MGSSSGVKQARTKRRRNQVRSEILLAAREIILADGLEGFSLAAVAEALELTKPALYYYFNSKPALIFDLILEEWAAGAAAVEAAVETTETGADAVEALMRTVFERYRENLGMFMLSYRFHRSSDLESMMGAAELERVRPLNRMLYGGTEERLALDQKRGVFPKDRKPRVFAFNAHMAVIGILTMKAMVESAADPLVHTDDELIGDICRTFRQVATKGEGQ